MSKKLQATVEDPLLEEIKEVMKKEKFFEESEFVKHCIRQYLIKCSIKTPEAPGGLADGFGFGSRAAPQFAEAL